MMPQRVYVTEGWTSMTCRRKQSTRAAAVSTMEHGLYGEVERDITASRRLYTATVPLPPHQTRASDMIIIFEYYWS